MEIKNCPFCNSKPIGPEHGDEDWWIECTQCEIVMDHFSKKELIKRWNNRCYEKDNELYNY